MDGCGAPEQSGTLTADAGDQVVVAGAVTQDGNPLPGAFVRLLDAGGEFTAEVVAGEGGEFRFYAAAGDWTVRALHRAGSGETPVSAAGAGVHQADIAVP